MKPLQGTTLPIAFGQPAEEHRLGKSHPIVGRPRDIIDPPSSYPAKGNHEVD